MHGFGVLGVFGQLIYRQGKFSIMHRIGQAGRSSIGSRQLSTKNINYVLNFRAVLLDRIDLLFQTSAHACKFGNVAEFLFVEHFQVRGDNVSGLQKRFISRIDLFLNHQWRVIFLKVLRQRVNTLTLRDKL